MKIGLQKSALLLARTGLLCSLVACGMEPWESMPYKSELKVAQLSDGTEIRYSVAEPPLLDAEDPPTIVIAMPLGLETYRNASLTISEIWQPIGQKPNIRTTILISDQVRYWSRDDSILPFDVPGVAIKKIPIPGLLSEEGIGPVLASLPFICLEIETAIHPREEE